MKILILIFSFVTLAHARPGFYSVNDRNLPPAIAAAAPSIFEVRTAFFEDFENQTDISVVDLRGNNRAAVLARIDREVSDPRDRAITRAFVNRCRTPDQVANCPIPHSIGSGSGFITGTGTTFWTNAHVLEKTLKMKAANNERSLTDILRTPNTLPVFIFNQRGEMVFNGLENPIRFTAVPRPTALSQARGEFYAEDSDYLAFELPQSLGRGLRISRGTPSPAVAVMGYPACTGCPTPVGMDPDEYADRGLGANAEDCIQKVTGGRIIPHDTWAQLADIQAASMQLVNRQTFFGYDADSQHGLSGAPVLDFNGNVVGIHAGGKSVRRNGTVERYSRGVRPPEFNFIN